MNSQTWLENLGNALQEWMKNSPEHTIDGLAEMLGVSRRVVFRVMKGEYIIAEKSDPNFYAKLFRITALPEADPRGLPPEKNGRLRAWSHERLEAWWNMYYPQDRVAESAVVEHPNPWVEFFYKELLELTSGDAQMREAFYKRNHTMLGEIIQLLQVLNQREAEREESLRLMEVLT